MYRWLDAFWLPSQGKSELLCTPPPFLPFGDPESSLSLRRFCYHAFFAQTFFAADAMVYHKMLEGNSVVKEQKLNVQRDGTDADGTVTKNS